MIAHHQSLQ
jgi:hypothetical protein